MMFLQRIFVMNISSAFREEENGIKSRYAPSCCFFRHYIDIDMHFPALAAYSMFGKVFYQKKQPQSQ